MKVIERLTIAEIQLRSPPVVTAAAENYSLTRELLALRGAPHLCASPAQSIPSSSSFHYRLYDAFLP